MLPRASRSRRRLDHATGAAATSALRRLVGENDDARSECLCRDEFQACPFALLEEQLEREGQVRVWWEDTPIDLFLDVLSFHREVAKGVRHVPLMERTIPVLSCTALAVFKAMFGRTRDWADIEAMVEVAAVDLDAAAHWVQEMDGPDSHRARRLISLRS